MNDEYGPTLRTSSLKGIRRIDAQVATWRNEVANPRRRVPLGWPAVDEIVRGPAGGEVFTVLARSGVGKSLVATNVMAHNMDRGILFFSLEMPEAQVLQRLAAHVFDIPIRDIEQSEHNRELLPVVDELAARLPNHVIVDDSNLSLDEMTAYVLDYSEYLGFRPQLVIIDYLEEIKTAAEGEKENRIAAAVKAWAKDQKLGVLNLHQTNRTVKNYEAPNEDSARYQGYTEADVVIGLWRPGWDPAVYGRGDRMRDNWIAMNVIKNRVRGIKHDGFEFEIDPAMLIKPRWYQAPEPAEGQQWAEIIDFHNR